MPSADIVAQISSCSIFRNCQFKMLEELWCSSPTIFKMIALTSPTSEIPTFLPISAKPRVKYVEVSLLISLRGARSSAWWMRPLLPSYKIVSGGQTNDQGLTLAKRGASAMAIFFSVAICWGYAFANDPYGDVFNTRTRELLVYFGTADTYD